MPTNLNLTQSGITRLSGYFYSIDANTDTMVKRTDNGLNAFSYPTSDNITNTVRCIQNDTVFFYTLENITTANGGNGQLLFKKWKIEDFILELKRTYTLNGIASQKYDCNSFAVEHYVRTFSGTAISGSTSISGSTNSRIVAGDILQLGPSTFTGDVGESEEVTVLSTAGANVINLTTPIQKNYNIGDKISFANNIWFFNKFRPSDTDTVSGTGELYSFGINPLVTTIIPRKGSNEFRTVLASAYLKDNYYSGGARELLAYANQTNIIFIEVDSTNVNFLVDVESAAQNNQETTSTVIPILAIATEGDTLFRIQQKGTFRAGNVFTTENWTPNFNYQLATMQRIPSSISLSSNPPIIAADGITTSDITAIVKDQFDNAVPSRLVNFSENDTVGAPAGLVTPTSDTTDANGIAETDYKAGTQANTVIITATT